MIPTPIRLLAPAAALALATLPASAADDMKTSKPAVVAVTTVAVAKPAVLLREDIPYAVGGIGIDSREAMSKIAAQFNTQLAFAAGEDRHHIVEVDVQIVDADGRPRFVLPNAGPILYVDLPEGTYEVQALYQGELQRRRIEVDADGQPAREGFRW